jgi:hypothetical protein
MGVGDIPRPPHPQYLLPVKKYSYSVSVRLYDTAKEKPEELKNQMMRSVSAD